MSVNRNGPLERPGKTKLRRNDSRGISKIASSIIRKENEAHPPPFGIRHDGQIVVYDTMLSAFNSSIHCLRIREIVLWPSEMSSVSFLLGPT